MILRVHTLLIHVLALLLVTLLALAPAQAKPASGFAVGFGTELVAGRLGDGFVADPAMDAQGQQVARLAFEQDRAALVGASLGYITSGGNAVNVNQGSSLARSAVAYNRQLHLNEKETLTRLLGRDVDEDIFDGDLEALTPEDRALLAAACGFVHCSDHINADDPTYAQRLALQQEGRALIAQRSAAAVALLANAVTVYSSFDTITMLNSPGASGWAQGGFLYTGTDARMDIAQAMGYDIFGQARADVIAAMPSTALDGAINLGAGALAFAGCAGGVAADCEAFVKRAGEAITTTVTGIRAIPGYPDMLRNVDLATARFIYGEIDRTTYATILADAGRLQGGADAVIVSLGLGDALGGLRLPNGKAPDVMAPNSPIVPGGGLQAHEAAGGHLISRHVGKSDAYLGARLNSQPNITAASSFPDRATAERAVSSALDANTANISQFLNGTGGRLVINHNVGSSVGNVMSRGATTSAPSSNVRVVIQRDATMPTGYRIITGFPVP